ncbi:MAG: RdgB/HAM1 family non-canonical purine NTP pyrophosphatase [Chloroflexota bacterium]|nr:RdgB/HAM1 family non-canonical purine NTP pyrophosphatase [Chloroflexota bacterium]
MKNKLLIASENPGKIKEIKSILSPFDGSLMTPKDMNLSLTVEETGDTYTKNARLKAFAYLKASGSATLADDSGLEVAALDGSPGIYSARFSPKPNATDSDRRIYLLEKLKGIPQPWKAHFHCAAVLAIPSGMTFETTGRCDGVIISQERGTGGFGYDPIFFIPEFSATMAELSPCLKNTISHRAKALAAMLPMIQSQLATN